MSAPKPSPEAALAAKIMRLRNRLTRGADRLKRLRGHLIHDMRKKNLGQVLVPETGDVLTLNGDTLTFSKADNLV